MKNYKLSSTLLATLLLCSTPYLFADRADEDRVVGQIGEVDTRHANTELSSDQVKANVGINYEEIMYEHILANNNKEETVEVYDQPVPFAYDIKKEREDTAARMADAASQRVEEQQRQLVAASKRAFSAGRGYCYLDEEVAVQKIASYVMLSCDLNQPIGHVTLGVSMVPEFYAKALIGNPLYIVREDERIPVKNGVVMTKDRNSINLASIVNDSLLKKIAATSVYKGIGVVATQAQEYLNQKIASDTQQQQGVQGGLTPITTTITNTRPPDPYTYIAVAGIQVVSQIAKIVGENYVQDLPFTFKIAKGRVFYVDLQFANGDDMEGYKVLQPNVIKKAPGLAEGKDGILQPVKPTEIVPVVNNHMKENKVTRGSTSATTRNIRTSPPVSREIKIPGTKIPDLNSVPIKK